jgi:two-component system, cell cycle sensor histidine kinase and response regulator CckA
MRSHHDRERPRIILLEDNQADAELCLRELARARFESDSEIVSTSREFTQRLQSQQYDLILAGYCLPDWTGLEALRWLRNSGFNTPFILVTGTLGDDLAVQCMKEGATDYVLKGKLDRLPRACRRALEEARLRVQRDRAENDLRASEEQFRQAQKMEAVGRLATGIAHDFNNMLTVIIGHSELLQESFAAGPARKRVDEIKKAGERAASLTRQLLVFSRRQVLLPRVLNLNAVVDNLSLMLRHMIGEDIELVNLPGCSLGCVKADPIQLEQVIVNLAVNARDAMPRGGKLVIATTNSELDEAYAAHHPPVHPGSYVLLTVSDTGCGMSAETMLHIFEPFYTTKGPGQGTGLGLSMVDAVVNRSGGSIWVCSEPGKGTTFKIYLPRVDEPTSMEEPKAEHPSVRGSETILLVEDDEPLRLLVTDILEDSGYTVLPASESKEATTLAKQHGRIDMLMTDVVMPGQSGTELAASLKLFLPDLKVHYMSGYRGDFVTQHGVLETEGKLLEKPFTKESLLNRVRLLLDGQ